VTGLAAAPFLSRRSIAAIACTAVAAVAVGVAAGQGGGAAGTSTARAPACAKAGRVVVRPTEIPANVLPPRTILTRVRRQHGVTFTSGVAALSFQEAVRFFVTSLPAAGYVNGLGDAEMDEAESFFTGARLHGKWKVNGIAGCPRAVRLALFVQSYPTLR
jgi:hypothetical protein